MHFKLFEQAVYSNRRQALMQQVGNGLIVLMGNEETGMNYKDNWYPFRQDSSFLYYFGLDVAGLVAILDPESSEIVIFGNELSIDDIVWTGPLPSLKEMAGSVGVNKTAPYNDVAVWIRKAQALGRAIHILPPYRAENRIRLGEWLQVPVQDVDRQVSIKLIKAVIGQRVIKEAIEVGEIEKAVTISADMHLAGIQYAKPGMKEFEVAAKVQEVAYAAGGRLSYPIICTINGETLHNHYYGNTIAEGQMLLLDAGAENDLHYAGDLTRTFPVGNKFTTEQKEVYNIVINSMDHAISLLKPGVRFRDVHAGACEKLVEGLAAMGIMKGNAAEAVAAGAHTLFFQCGLGHMMGMDVHDMEDLGEQYVGYSDDLQKSKEFGWKSLRLGRAVEPGYVLTIEPGVYVIPSLIDQWAAEKKHSSFINYKALESFRNFSGIRVEDNFLVTAEGSRKLGKYLPKTADEIEALRQ
ncbi:aminopeptidase P family protein [Paraflavitalea sp. CAU 1676]|uniref:aminopeptidase P family protein n=1 Tax=Paraflavitalea sp. CAU 1676 TaxID=3032598 RepID=UPI0023DCB4EE|nr:aminopeptidase P family protein [Paraflavitalea sp. CAU 1676]MDF2190980.1 Xaa-Pro aminopeptidase [Paraflavitalea sp. CAU 1676]